MGWWQTTVGNFQPYKVGMNGFENFNIRTWLTVLRRDCPYAVPKT